MVKLATLLLLCLASILIVIWLFRSGSGEKYREYGEIPLKDYEDKNIELKSRDEKSEERIER
jgi:cbb3-type cytochrome oxidase subunit 3